MANRLFNIAATVSAAMFVALIGLWVVAEQIDCRRQYRSLTGGCHLSVTRSGADARLLVFNNPNYGPYSGSIVGVSGSHGTYQSLAFGDTAGIYIRSFGSFGVPHQLWTAAISLLYPIVFSAVLPAVWLLRTRRRRRRGFPVGTQQTAV